MYAALVRDGVVHTGGADIAVPWWSFTKTVLAAAALSLVAARRLQLDAHIGDDRITLRQLLQHRAGLPDYGSLAAYHAAVARGDPPWPEADMLRRAGAQSAPGTRFAYSNIGYLRVAHLIEAAADTTLAQALHQRVLKPLGVPNVRLARLPADLDGTAWGNAAGYHPGWVYHGLLLGTPIEAALLLHRLLSGELLEPGLLKQMCAPEPIENGAGPGRPWHSVGYGLGLGIGQIAAGTFTGHSGAGPGSVASVYHHGGATAAAFAAGDNPGIAEIQTIAMLTQG